MSNLLTIEEMVTLLSKAPEVPILKPTSASVGPYECPVCLEYKPYQTVFHQTCEQPCCINCALNIIDLRQKCPSCRTHVVPDESTSTPEWTLFTPPTRRDIHFFDQTKYKCETCDSELIYFNAKNHANTCWGTGPRPQRPPQPPHIPQWGTEPIEIQTNIVSNPFSKVPPTNPCVPIIHHLNGRQIVSKMTPKYKSIRQIQEQVAKLAQVDVDSIQTYKFMHRRLPTTTTIREIAPEGATHLCHFTNRSDLELRTAMLQLGELGPPPVIERQDEEVW